MSITLLRRQKGLSTKAIAEKMGIHYSYYSHLENGRRKFTTELKEKLAEVLNLPLFVIEGEVEGLEKRTFAIPSWINSIKISGINSVKAFENHLRLNPPTDENIDLKTAFAEFIQKNIAMSIMSEFDANPELARMLKYKLEKVLIR